MDVPVWQQAENQYRARQKQAPSTDNSDSLTRYHCGYLMKKGLLLNQWKRRYFVADGTGILYYFKSRDAYEKCCDLAKPFKTSCSGFIEIRNQPCGPAGAMVAKYKFSFLIVNKTRTFLMYAEREDEYTVWRENFILNKGMWFDYASRMSVINEDGTVTVDSTIDPYNQPRGAAQQRDYRRPIQPVAREDSSANFRSPTISTLPKKTLPSADSSIPTKSKDVYKPPPPVPPANSRPSPAPPANRDVNKLAPPANRDVNRPSPVAPASREVTRPPPPPPPPSQREEDEEMIEEDVSLPPENIISQRPTPTNRDVRPPPASRDVNRPPPPAPMNREVVRRFPPPPRREVEDSSVRGQIEQSLPNDRPRGFTAPSSAQPSEPPSSNRPAPSQRPPREERVERPVEREERSLMRSAETLPRPRAITGGDNLPARSATMPRQPILPEYEQEHTISWPVLLSKPNPVRGKGINTVRRY